MQSVGLLSTASALERAGHSVLGPRGGSAAAVASLCVGISDRSIFGNGEAGRRAAFNLDIQLLNIYLSSSLRSNCEIEHFLDPALTYLEHPYPRTISVARFYNTLPPPGAARASYRLSVERPQIGIHAIPCLSGQGGPPQGPQELRGLAAFLPL